MSSPLRDQRIRFNVKKALRCVRRGGSPQVIYAIEDARVCMAELNAYITSALDSHGASRICVVGKLCIDNNLPRFRYNPATDKFDKT